MRQSISDYLQTKFCTFLQWLSISQISNAIQNNLILQKHWIDLKRLNASYFVFKYSDKYRFKRTFQDFVWFQCLRYMTVTIFILTMIANEMGYKRIKQQIKRNSCERFWIILFKVYLIKWGLQNYEINYRVHITIFPLHTSWNLFRCVLLIYCRRKSLYTFLSQNVFHWSMKLEDNEKNNIRERTFFGYGKSLSTCALGSSCFGASSSVNVYNLFCSDIICCFLHLILRFWNQTLT